MSLVTLTFGHKCDTAYAGPHAVISTPEQTLREKISNSETMEGKATIKKACKFYAQQELYVVAEVEQGYLSKDMKAFYNGRELQVMDIESKYGHNAKQGMTVGITLNELNETEFEKGTTIEFRK